MSKPKAEEIMGLVEFARRERRREAKSMCPVCALPQFEREQLQEAQNRGERLKYQLQWLGVLGHKITAADLTSHRSGRHDDDEAA